MRRVAFVALMLGLLVVGGGVAAARSVPTLRATGPTQVNGTEASSVFRLGARTVRQIRYDDGGTLTYSFRVSNPGRLPLEVLGLAADQEPNRLFQLTSVDALQLAPGGSGELRLMMTMGGCESLSARAGAFVTDVRVRTVQAGVFADEVTITLPEELHTGSPREAFCPNSTATSRPPG